MTTLRLHNTLTRGKEDFVPLDAAHVRVYACGPTVYDRIHVGNARPIVVFDVLVRLLRRLYPNVTYVRNITDVDDKIITRAAERGIGIDRLCDDTIECFHEDVAALGALPPDHEPRATEFISDMIDMIQTLIDGGYAYAAEGHVLFSVAAMPAYGALSGRSMEDMIAGARVEVAPYKRDPADFVLWKPSSPDQPGWENPFSDTPGRPGWHIECSTMSMQVLETEVLDIHTGGEDLIFPHHECEIAQSCGATGNELFSRFWMHTRFLLVEGEKMSKSKGNFFTVRDVLSGKATGTPVHPAVLRMELIKAHYRAHSNFTAKGLTDSANIVRRLTELGQRLRDECGGVPKEIDRTEHPVVSRFLQALANDLNISEAMTVVHAWISSPGGDASEAYGVLLALDQVLGVWELTADDSEPQDPESDIAANLCTLIDEARGARDFSAADAHRDHLIQLGYEVRSSPDGTSAKKKLA